MKKVIITLAATLTMLIVCTTTFASNVYVQLNGEIVDFTDSNGNRVDAQIVNSRTMVPLRKIFELLGATVDWDNNTRTAFATKDDVSIKLQIDNPVAEVTESGIVRKIQLDSKPILINDRTMVPLRFISESLGKQVAWDAREQTAIIIDYDYFANQIKKKSPILYKAITAESEVTTIQISREYYDQLNSSNNTTSNVFATISNDSENTQSILVDFSGTSELFREIKNEGWSSIGLVAKFDDDGITYSSNMQILNQMLPKKNYTYEELELSGKYDDTFSEALKNFFGVKEEDINIITFARMKNDFNNFLSLFNVTNGTTSTNIRNNKFNSITTNNILYDYAMFDNIIFNNEFAKSFNVINKLFFNYDVEFDNLVYDYPTIDMNIKIQESGEQITSVITITLVNNFNEKVIYNIKVAK